MSLLAVRLVARVNGRSRAVKRLSALGGGRGSDNSRSSRSGDLRVFVAHWAMTLVSVGIQEVVVAVVVCLDAGIAQNVRGLLVDAASEGTVGEHQVGDDHIDKSTS